VATNKDFRVKNGLVVEEGAFVGGNLGIGAATPTDKLEVYGNVAGSVRTVITNVNAAGTSTLRFSNATGAAAAIFENSGNQFTFQNATAGGALRFQTTTAAGATSNAIFIDANQNIGIGTSSPTQKLHVNGNIKMEANTYIYGANESIYLGEDASAYYVMAGANTMGTSKPIILGANPPLVFRTNTIEQVRITTAGNFGIGTSSPSAKLDVNGTLISGNATISNAALNASLTLNPGTATFSNILMRGASNSMAAGLDILAGSGQSYFSADIHNFRNAAQTTTYATIASTGLGIGTSSPDRALTVSINNTVNGDLIHLQNLASSTANQNWYIGMGWQGAYDGYFKIGRTPGSSDFSINESGFPNTPNSWNVSGSGGLVSTNNANTGVYLNSGQSLTLSGRDSVRFSISLAEQMRLTPTGLGIGTSSPEYKLHVTGGGIFSNSGLRLGTGYSAIDVATGASGLYLSGTQGALNHLFVSPSGNVGVGTITPTQVLDVRGWGRFGKAGNDAGIEFEGGYGKIYRATASGNIIIDPQVNSVFLNGNVGIGTTTPGSKLTVSGAAGDGVAIASIVATSLPAYTNRFFDVKYNASDVMVLDFINEGHLKIPNGLVTTKQLVLTAAAYAGSASTAAINIASGNLMFGYNGTTSLSTISSYWNLDIDSYYSGNVIFKTLGVERARVNNAGNVGIGTSSPGSKLAVNGSITESTDGVNYYNVVTQQDIGTEPNEIPLNQYLGSMAYQNAESITVTDLRVNGNLAVVGSQTLAGSVALGDTAGDTLTINAGTTTFVAGTANGVAYLNGSKVLTTDIGFTFNGTSFAVGYSASINTSGRFFADTGSAASPGYQFTGWPGTGMFFPASGNLAWSINTAEQMRLNSTGLGIGTSSPTAKLDVTGTIVGNIATFFNDGNSTNSKGIKIQGGTDNGFGENYRIEFFDGDGTASGRFSTNTGSVLLEGAKFIFNDSGADYDFQVKSINNTHALFVQGSDGNVGIGTGFPTKKLDVNGDALINGVTVGLGAGAVAQNTAIGPLALAGSNTGTRLTALGYGTLNSNTSGSFNTAVGHSALVANSTGSTLTAVGASALAANTTGSSNTAVGRTALTTSTTGSNNTAMGDGALALSTTASENTAVGYQAGYSNTTGRVTAFGYQAGYSNTTNSIYIGTFIGHQAGYNNTTGAGHTYIGHNAGKAMVSNNWSTAVGYNALAAATGGINTAVGAQAAQATTTGIGNVAVGSAALISNTTASNNTALGHESLYSNTTGEQNVGAGGQTLYNSTTGTANVALGWRALFSNTTANSNIAIGQSALYAATTGYGNTATGGGALRDNTTGTYNTANGYQALYSNTASLNVGVGFQAAYSNTTGLVTAVGNQAAYSNTTGLYVVAIGDRALYSNTTAYYNTAVGAMAGYSNTTGTIVALGYQAGYSNSTGVNNTAVGQGALFSNTSGSQNIAIGESALYSNTTGGANVAVGRGALATSNGEDNVAVGYYSLNLNTTGIRNVAIGRNALNSNTTGSSNTATGWQALYSNTTGYQNTAAGYQSLYANTTGISNTANGYGTLRANTTGESNTATGFNALYSNTTGYQNTATGLHALHLNTTGNNNTAVGYQSLYYNTTGPNNVAVGYHSGHNLTTGDTNTLVGQRAGFSMTSGGGNVVVGSAAAYSLTTPRDIVAIGNIAAYSNTTGGGFVAIGYGALYSNTTGNDNTAIGQNTLRSNTTGINNTAIGLTALFANTTGSANTATGLQALRSNTTGSNNTAIGLQSLFSNTTGQSNTATGVSALFSNTTGNQNTASGYYALYLNTTGDNNTAHGFGALYSNTTGTRNVGFGGLALYSNTTGTDNTAVGYEALLFNTTGVRNAVVGLNAMYSNTTGNDNTAIGYHALFYNTTGNANTASGHRALYLNTTGTQNTATGYYALYSNTTASGNTASGYQALQSNTTGEQNVGIGVQALYVNSTGAANVALGWRALFSNTTGSNNVAIGYGALQNNTTTIQNTAVGYGAGATQTAPAVGNTYFGFQAGSAVTTGYANLFVGRLAGSAMTTGYNNVIIGTYSGNSGGLDIRTTSNNIVLSDGDGNLRIVINGSTGNVGIGTTAPTAKLDISGSSLHLTETSANLDTFKVLVDSGGAGYSHTYLKGQNQAIATYANPQGSNYTVNSNVYSAQSSGVITNLALVLGAGNSERMRITSTGNVGIGTTAPTAKLEVATNVANSTETLLNLFNINNSATPGVAMALTTINVNSTATVSNTYSNGHLIFSINTKDNFGGTSRSRYMIYSDANGVDVHHRWHKSDGAEAMRLNNAGNVGIGTSSPSSRLHVEGGSLTANFITSSSSGLIRLGDSVAGANRKELTVILNTTDNRVEFQAVQQGVAFMPITLNAGGGNVGIGVASPIARLQVEEVGIDTTATTIAIGNGQTSIYSVGTTLFRTIEFMVQVTQGSAYHAVKLFALHNGTDVWFNQTNVLHTAAELGTFSMDISGGNVRLLYTPTSTATASTVKVAATMITV
jgi:hypothetical protein